MLPRRRAISVQGRPESRGSFAARRHFFCANTTGRGRRLAREIESGNQVAKIGGRASPKIQHRVFLGFTRRPGDLLLHACQVAVQKGELIEKETQIGGIEIPCQRFVAGRPGFVESIQMNLRENEVAKVETLRRTQVNCLAELRNSLIVVSEVLVDDAEIRVGHRLARIDLSPELVDLARLLEVASDKVMVVGFDVELFPLTDASAKVVGFPGILR